MFDVTNAPGQKVCKDVEFEVTREEVCSSKAEYNTDIYTDLTPNAFTEETKGGGLGIFVTTNDHIAENVWINELSFDLTDPNFYQFVNDENTSPYPWSDKNTEYLVSQGVSEINPCGTVSYSIVDTLQSDACAGDYKVCVDESGTITAKATNPEHGT